MKFFMYLLLVLGLVMVATEYFDYPATMQSSQSGELHLEVNGAASDDGFVYFLIYDSEAAYLSGTPVRTERRRLYQGQAEWIITGLPAGTYAVAVFHDINNNGKFDSAGLFFRSREPYGFSNGIVSGKPDYDRISFGYNGGLKVIPLTVR